MKKTYIIGNWKMHKTIQETIKFMSDIETKLAASPTNHVVVGVCPSYISLEAAQKRAKQIHVFAQNCHEKEQGAYTGEVSVSMLKEVGITGCLVGHSERRTYFHETSKACNSKLHALFARYLQPIYCIGETLEEYKSHQTKAVVEQQIKEGLANLSRDLVQSLIIAYEPVWSIGTGRNASKEIAQDVADFIRNTVSALYDEDTAKSIKILYGGSVNPTNVASYVSCQDIDGVLVGGASLDADRFLELIGAVTVSNSI